MSEAATKPAKPLSDRLLSVAEVARRLGVSTTTVVEDVRSRGLRSLDEGSLILQGDQQTPLIRERELRRFVSDQIELVGEAAPGQTSSSIVDSEPVLAAYALVTSLQEGNRELTWNASSEASHTAIDDPERLATWWYEYLDIANAPEPGVASGVHPIRDGFVAVKFLADTPPSGGVMKHGTVVYAIPIAVVEDPAGWRVDQPLQDRVEEWIEIYSGSGAPSSAPGSASSAEGPKPANGPT